MTADPPQAETAEAAADFENVRSRLFGIAYHMLGRAADAEDVVQDVWVRWQGADWAQVRDPVAFLVGEDAAFVTGEAVAVNGGAFMD